MYETDTAELFELFSDIRHKTASGYDEISIEIIENLPIEVLKTLVSLINLSFRNGMFPSLLKMSVVISLHKGGTLEEPSNYRPISIIPTIAKIIKKLLKRRLLEFNLTHNIITESQFGFQNNKNMHDAIFSFLFELYSDINAGDVAAAVFCDLKKAFDCVDHEILLRKLNI